MSHGLVAGFSLFAPLVALACASTPLKSSPGLGAEGGAPASDGPAAALELEPGEVVELSVADGSAAAHLAAPNGSEKFVLIVGSTNFASGAQSLGYSLSSSAGGAPSTARALSGCSLSSRGFGDSALVSDPAPSGPAPMVGDTRALSISTPAGASLINAKVVAVGEHSVVWLDTNDATPLDPTFAAEFLRDFEATIMPRERAVFGTEPDLDGDGRIQLVFSALTYQTGIAFFTGCDLLDKLPGCVGSNHGEYLYLTPPDAIDPPYNTANAIKEILVHETSHLLHFNRKVLKNALRTWPDGSYMIEGVGALAQDVIGYQAGNLYVTMAGLDGLAEFSLADTLNDNAYDSTRDGVLRGGSYLFSRYLYDRGGGDSVDATGLRNLGGPAFLRALIDSPKAIASALPELGKSPIEAIAMDFFTALAMSNREEAAGAAAQNPCFAYLPTARDPVTADQRGADLFAAFHGMHMNGPALQRAASADGKLLAGGVELIELDASSASSELDFSIHVDPQALPRVRVGRWN
jgi:hypothetical protein